MTSHVTPELERAALIEGNETSAYRSLFQVGRTLHGADRFRCVDRDGLTAFLCPDVALPGAFNRVMKLGIASTVDAGLLSDLVALYAEAGCGMAVELVHPAKNEATAAALKAQRIRRSGVSAVVCHDAPVALEQPRPGVTVELARGTDRDFVAQICAEVFAMPPMIRSVLAAVCHEPDWLPWLVRLQGQPAGAGLTHLDGDRAWFGWAATLPAFRGHGLKSALDDAHLADAARRGCRLVTAETAAGTAERPDHSLKSFLRTGFEIAYLRDSLFRVPAANTGAALARETPRAAGSQAA
jgi:GNAT superfamily N-acetyltransferase